MLFNTYSFLFAFLPIVLLGYYLLRYFKLNSFINWWLVIASLYFYGQWNYPYLILLIGSMSVNYTIGYSLFKVQLSRPKLVMQLGVVFNLVLLAYFKYSYFISENFSLIGINLTIEKVVLPLAISFFTFQQISFLIDSYHKRVSSYELSNYLLYVSFFPQLIAGPIVHHSEMMPQFKKLINEKISWNKINKGVFILSMGLFKKVVIADSLATWVNNGYSHSTDLNIIEAWFSTLAYSMQLYFDFSGYTDMAWGIALFFGIQLPANFNSPYKAKSIQDFWKRWHITLSRFLKDYIYIPLGGNRKGETRTLLNLLITFILGGIWHGAAWTFLAWGIFHGLALVIHRIWIKQKIKMPNVLAWFLTFLFVNFTWIFFRADNFDQAWQVLSAMFNFNEMNISNGGILKNIGANKYSIVFLVISLTIALIGPNSNELINYFKPNKRNLIFSLLLIITSLLMLNKLSEFLYFQF